MDLLLNTPSAAALFRSTKNRDFLSGFSFRVFDFHSKRCYSNWYTVSNLNFKKQV